MKSLEKLAYESRPYAYALIALYSICNYQISKLMFVSGILLAVCSYLVFMLRRESRRVPVVSQKSNKKL